MAHVVSLSFVCMIRDSRRPILSDSCCAFISKFVSLRTNVCMLVHAALCNHLESFIIAGGNDWSDVIPTLASLTHADIETTTCAGLLGRALAELANAHHKLRINSIS
jgi:hypothetical protein